MVARVQSCRVLKKKIHGGRGIVVHQAQHVLIPGSSWCRDELELNFVCSFPRRRKESSKQAGAHEAHEHEDPSTYDASFHGPRVSLSSRPRALLALLAG